MISTTRLRLTTAAALLTGLVAAGCGNREPAREAAPVTAPVDTTADATRTAAADRRITAAVQGKYFASDTVKGHDIDVDTSGASSR